jgi:hypothetical protein
MCRIYKINTQHFSLYLIFFFSFLPTFSSLNIDYYILSAANNAAWILTECTGFLTTGFRSTDPQITRSDHAGFYWIFVGFRRFPDRNPVVRNIWPGQLKISISLLWLQQTNCFFLSFIGAWGCEGESLKHTVITISTLIKGLMR